MTKKAKKPAPRPEANTVPISLRIDREVYECFKAEAKRTKIPAQTLIKSVLFKNKPRA